MNDPLHTVADVCAQAFPSKPVRVLVGANVGSASDAPMRIVTGQLSTVWKQQIVMENRVNPGAIVVIEIFAKATPDGYALLACSAGSHGIAPVLHKKLPYDYIKDFSFISRRDGVANVLNVNPAAPAKSVNEFVDYAKASAGKVPYSSSGVGNTPHLTVELLWSMAGINLIHIPTEPGQLSPQEVANESVMAIFANITSSLPLMKSGKLHALAVKSVKRNAQLPDVPTMINSGFANSEVVVWSSICGPAGVPKQIVSKINTYLRKVLSLPDTHKRLAEQGIEVTPSTPEQFAAFEKVENARWTTARKSTGLQTQ